MQPTAAANRYATIIKWVSVLLMIAALAVAARVLPLDQAVDVMREWVKSLGWVGPLVFGGIYVVATVLFVPGAILTLAAGAIFGLLWGTVTTSIASVIGASLAFIIARYFARSSVEHVAADHPRFKAIDAAIEEGGWKIVAMLRLSPAIPFNLQNYLYGLTPVRFWTYVLTSWLAMLPGTFMYVYLGYLGAEAAGGRGKSVWQWVALGVGLVATIAVTVYVTYLARKKLKAQTSIEDQENKEQEHDMQTQPEKTQAQEGNTQTPETQTSETGGWPWGATVAAAVAVLLWIGVGISYAKKDALSGIFGPKQVHSTQAYAKKPNGPTFDSSAFTALLHKHVNKDGGVDYAGFKQDAQKLDAYIDRIGKAPFDQMGRDQKLALLLNAYNACTIRLILDNYPIKSIKDIPKAKRWQAERWNVGGHTWSLDDIEQKQIRPKFKEARVHFALVCAAVGCPPLRTEAYTAGRLDQQLQDQASYCFSHPTWFQYDRRKKQVKLTPLMKWYHGDFEQAAGSRLKFAARYSSALKKTLQAGHKPSVQFLNYDWSLNSQHNVATQRLGAKQ